MNNKTIETANALGEMDDSLVSEAVRASAGNRKSILPKLIAAAAALALIVGAAFVLPGLIKNSTNGVTAVLPTQSPETPPAVTEAPGGDTAATAAPAPETAEPTAEPPAGPTYMNCSNFSSVSAVAMAVSTNRNTNSNPALNGLTEIFMPRKVPYGATLDGIEITVDCVNVDYAI